MSTVIRTFERLRSLHAEGGWRLLLVVALERVPGVQVYTLMAQPVSPSVLPSPGRTPGFRIVEVSAADYDPAWFPRPAELVELRYRQGSVCFAAFRDDEALGCLWLCPGDYREDMVRCLFRPQPVGQAAWDFDVYIAPKHRLGRVFAALWQTGQRWLEQHGYRWSMSRIAAGNSASLRSHRRMGARSVGSVLFWRRGRWQLTLASRSPYLHWSGDDAAIPIIEVHPATQ